MSNVDQQERTALENERRAVEQELQMVNHEIAALGGGHNESTWNLQTRRRSLEARLQSLAVRLR